MIKISPFTPLFFNPSTDEFGVESRYVQVFAPEDNILVQVLTDGGESVIGQLKNVVSGTAVDLDFAKYSMSSSVDVYTVELSDIAEGYYTVLVNGQESDIFHVTSDENELSATALIKYTSNTNKHRSDVVFMADDVQYEFQFRVPGGFKDDDWAFEVNNEQFDTGDGNIVELYAIESTQKTFTMGNAMGCPIWFGEHLNRILCSTHFYINDVRYVRKGNSTPEVTQEIQGQKSYIFKVQLQGMVDNVDIELPSSSDDDDTESEGGGAGYLYLIKVGDNTRPTDSNTYSALRMMLEVQRLIEENSAKLDDKYLRKDQPDTAAHEITFNKGLNSKGDVIIGEEGYAEGFTGFGTKFGKDGSGEMSRLTLRHELRVPSIVYNQVEILVGDKWRAPGAGVIERVLPDYDENGNRLDTGTLWLKLEKGQIGAVFVHAICQGIFHDWKNTKNNATEDGEIYSDADESGKQTLVARTFAGFTTCYFTITEISDYTDEEGTTYQNKQCRYQIRPVSGKWTGTAHPFEQMNFVAYGIFSTDSGMLEKYGTSVYETRTYTRMLWRQNTWEIGAANIAQQSGDLSNLNYHGMKMEGYSQFLHNLYHIGRIVQIKDNGTPILTANERGKWKSGETYDYYDRVSHNGCTWLCINESGTNSEPTKTDPSWLLEVEAGQSIKSYGQWKSSMTPVPANTIVTFAQKVWISNKETSEAPFPIYTDNDGNRLTYSDGGYIIASLIQSEDWDLLLDAPELTNGKDGEGLLVRYSSDKASWHDVYVPGDIWLQQRVGEDAAWSDPIRFVGEVGAAGADGTYHDYQFAVNDSLTVAPATGWQDAPTSVGIGQYLWMRTRFVDPNSEEENAWTAVRIGGEKGRGVEKVTEYYQVSASNTNAPTEWVKEEMPELTEKLKYLWNYEEIRYTDTEVVKTVPIVIGMFSKDGNGIAKVQEWYGLSYDSNTHPETWDEEILTPTQEVRFLWNRVITSYTNGEATEIIRLIAVHGEKGDSIVNKGQWKTGMAVPALGIVTMGGKTFMAKVETSNPPLWTYTDNEGNRLMYSDGGYVLTGGMNTDEYDLLVESGKDGADGKDYEYIYTHTKDNVRPATPTNVQQDDYIPAGWNDNAVGV